MCSACAVHQALRPAQPTQPRGAPLSLLRLPEGCGGRASPVCPGRRGAGTRAARRTAPTPVRAAPQLWLSETRPQWFASGSRRWCEPGSTSRRREKGPASLCLPLRSGGRAPPGPRRFPGCSGFPRLAGERAHKRGRPTRRRARQAAANTRPRAHLRELRREGNRNQSEARLLLQPPPHKWETALSAPRGVFTYRALAPTWRSRRQPDSREIYAGLRLKEEATREVAIDMRELKWAGAGRAGRRGGAAESRYLRVSVHLGLGHAL